MRRWSLWPIGMDYEHLSWWTCGGTKSSSPQGRFTCAGSSRAPQARTRYSGTSCAPCAGSSVNRSRSRPSYSPRSVGPPSAPQGLPAWSSGRGWRQSSALRRTRTCSGTPVATRWPIGDTTRGPCRRTLATATFSTLCVTLSYRRRDLRISGATSALHTMPIPFLDEAISYGKVGGSIIAAARRWWKARKRRLTPQEKLELRVKWKPQFETWIAEHYREQLRQDCIIRDMKRMDHYPQI